MPLDLLVPDLLFSGDAPSPRSARLRSVERWLARADIARDDSRTARQWLLRRYGVAPGSAAALTRLADAGSAEGAWMRADPVHLQVQGDALRLREASMLDVRMEEALALAATLQAHFASDGLELHVATPERWYVKLGSRQAPTTTPLDEAAGRDVFGLLPEEPWWRSAITEAQMILGSHEANARRESEGKPAINSVWFWGAGTLPPPVANPYSLVCANDALARGLARHAGAEVQALPRSASDIDLGPSVLAVVTDLAPEAIDEQWFAALPGVIERFDRVRVILPSPQATLVATLTGSARWRWFRSSKPLSAYA